LLLDPSSSFPVPVKTFFQNFIKKKKKSTWSKKTKQYCQNLTNGDYHFDGIFGLDGGVFLSDFLELVE
jgi:hypothetical protein